MATHASHHFLQSALFQWVSEVLRNVILDSGVRINSAVAYSLCSIYRSSRFQEGAGGVWGWKTCRTGLSSERWLELCELSSLLTLTFLTFLTFLSFPQSPGLIP